MHTLDIVTTVAFLLAFTAQASRLLVASRAFWSRFPAWVQTLLPVLVPTLSVFAEGLAGVHSWSDLSVQFVLCAGLLLPGLPSNRSAAPLQAGKDPKLSPSAGDVAVSAVVVAKQASVSPPPADDDDDGPTLPPDAALPVIGLLLFVLLAGHVAACSSAPPKPPCDASTLVGITAECSLRAFECGKAGVPKEDCSAIDECNERLDARRAECSK